MPNQLQHCYCRHRNDDRLTCHQNRVIVSCPISCNIATVDTGMMMDCYAIRKGQGGGGGGGGVRHDHMQAVFAESTIIFPIDFVWDSWTCHFFQLIPL